jgi:hypothetical protein
MIPDVAFKADTDRGMALTASVADGALHSVLAGVLPV